jgi:hypothetical protein
MLNDHIKHLTDHLHYMLENGLVKIFKILNPSADPGNVTGIPQAPSSSAPHETLETPPYNMSILLFGHTMMLSVCQVSICQIMIFLVCLRMVLYLFMQSWSKIG